MASILNLPTEVFIDDIFPRLDKLSIFYMNIILGFERIPSKQYFPEAICELIVEAGYKHYAYFHKLLDDKLAMEHAAKYGHSDILKHGKHRGHETGICRKTLNMAARFGHLECVKLLHKDCGVAIGTDTLCQAARGNQLKVLQYLNTRYHSRYSKDYNRIAMTAAKYGSITCLEYLRTHTALFGWINCFIEAAANDQIQMMEYILSNRRISLDTTIYNAVARYNRLLSLAYMLQNLIVTSDIYSYAVQFSRIEMLQQIFARGIPLDNETKQQCLGIARNNEVRQWLLDH